MALHNNSVSISELCYSPQSVYYSRLDSPNQPGRVVAINSNALGLVTPSNTPFYSSSQSSANLYNHTYHEQPLPQPVAVHSSHPISRSRRKVRFATGWVEHSKYVPHGYIEEVPPTDDYDTHPNGQLLRLNPRECSFSEFMEPLPPCTTPPPRPELRLQSLPPSPSEGEFAVQHSVVATESWAFCSSPSNEEQEYKIAGSVCTFINESLSATDRVCLFFRPTTWFFDFDAHIKTCMLIKASLSSLLHVLDGRTKLSMDEFIGSSPSWRQKYTDRLSSLDRTLARYLELAGSILLSTIKPDLVLSHLQGSEKKISRSASKISSSFERLRVQNLHARLAGVYLAAHEQRVTDLDGVHALGESSDDRAMHDASPGEYQASHLRSPSRRGSTTM